MWSAGCSSTPAALEFLIIAGERGKLFMNEWLRWLRRKEDAQATLFCFHHAGSGASTFQDWAAPVPPAVNLGLIQLPGRENRSSQLPFRRMEPLVAALADAVQDELKPPYAFFGHSMGA